MMQLVGHFSIEIPIFKKLTIEQYYCYLEAYCRYIDEHKK